MEPNNLPRRKSSTGEADDASSKGKGHRKTFVVGGAAKIHHRVPSYGKKLNQLGKLSALTSGETKAGLESTAPGSPRRSSIHRSASQKSLHEVKVPRRSSSTQNVPKMRRSSSHHGSTTRMTSLRPMTKVDKSASVKNNDSADTNVGNLEETRKKAGKKPTFVIEDEDDEDEENTISSSLPKTTQVPRNHNNPIHKERVPAYEAEPLPSEISIADTHAADDTAQDEASQQTNVSTNSVILPPKISEDANFVHARKTSPIRHSSASGGLLYHVNNKPIGPQLSREFVTSKDIQGKEASPLVHSAVNLANQTTPINSQPLTSRFLESPKRSSMQYPSQTPKENEFLPPSRSAVNSRSGPNMNLHSPHGSTTNLGGGSSRTQQKLMLQRASSIQSNDTVMPGQGELKSTVLSHPRAQKEVDRISREYKNVKRFRDPLKESAIRLYNKGMAVPDIKALRRTMTAMTLSNSLIDNKTPKVSHSSANLKQQTASASRVSLLNHQSQNLDNILAQMWQKDDHAPELEE